MIDDTCPQAGEMRSLWKGTAKFWTNEMPQDDTWEANRHHSHIFPLFRSQLTRDTTAMFPLRQNPVVSTKHECRNPHLPAVSHIENAHLLVRSRTNGTGKGNTCQLCGAIINDKGEITETNKSIQR